MRKSVDCSTVSASSARTAWAHADEFLNRADQFFGFVVHAPIVGAGWRRVQSAEAEEG